MRIVLDTNVLISAFISPAGTAYQVFELIKTSDMVQVMSQAVFGELGRVIRYPHLRSYATYSESQVERYLEAIKRTSFWVQVEQSLTVIENDESDNRFIELAVAGKARYIVTGDKKHLLPLRRYQGIEIVSPTEFFALYKSDNV